MSAEAGNRVKDLFYQQQDKVSEELKAVIATLVILADQQSGVAELQKF